MSNEYENAQEQVNQETGQDDSQSVGQDGTVEQQENSLDWEQQAKYFQSEKDKLHVENQKLKQYEKVGKFLESRPDVVEGIKNQVQGGQPNNQPNVVEKPKEFDPWEAYNDPSSDSYKYRVQEMEQQINGAVNSAVSQQNQVIQEQVGIQKLESELTARGLNRKEINEFMNFAAKNPAEYGVDTVIQMWRSIQGSEQIPANEQTNPLDQVRQTQQSPTAGGVLQGQQPKVKSDDDSMWEGIVKAGGRTNVLK